MKVILRQKVVSKIAGTLAIFLLVMSFMPLTTLAFISSSEYAINDGELLAQGSPISPRSPITPRDPIEIRDPIDIRDPMDIREPMDIRDPIGIRDPMDIRDPLHSGDPIERVPIEERDPVDDGSPVTPGGPLIGNPYDPELPLYPGIPIDPDYPLGYPLDPESPVIPGTPGNDGGGDDSGSRWYENRDTEFGWGANLIDIGSTVYFEGVPIGYGLSPWHGNYRFVPDGDYVNVTGMRPHQTDHTRVQNYMHQYRGDTPGTRYLHGTISDTHTYRMATDANYHLRSSFGNMNPFNGDYFTRENFSNMFHGVDDQIVRNPIKSGWMSDWVSGSRTLGGPAGLVLDTAGSLYSYSPWGGNSDVGYTSTDFAASVSSDLLISGASTAAGITAGSIFTAATGGAVAGSVVPGLGTVIGLGAGLVTGFVLSTTVGDRLQRGIKKGLDTVVDGAKSVGKSISNGAKAVGESISNGWNTVKGWFS